MLIHLESRVTIFVDASEEKGELFCWSSWVGRWIFMLKQLGRRPNFYVGAFREVVKFLCWCIWGANFAVNLGQSGQINERRKWIASAWPILSSPAKKIQSVMMHLRTNEKKTDSDFRNKRKGTILSREKISWLKMV